LEFLSKPIWLLKRAEFRLDESDVKSRVLEITRKALGEDHLATQIAADASFFIKDLAYPWVSWKPDDEGLELVEGFDRSSVSYIA